MDERMQPHPELLHLSTSVADDRSTHQKNGTGNKRGNGQGWYARLSDDKKSEYLQKQRMARQAKKDAIQSSLPSLGSVERIPFKDVTNMAVKGANDRVLQVPAAQSLLECSPFHDVTNTRAKGVQVGAENRSISGHPSRDTQLVTKPKGGQGWYVQMSDEKKAEYLNKLRISRQQKKVASPRLTVDGPKSRTPSISQMGSGQSAITNLHGNPGRPNLMIPSCTSLLQRANEGSTQNLTADNESDWLHRNDKYICRTNNAFVQQEGFTDTTRIPSGSVHTPDGQFSMPRSILTASEKKRQYDSQRYSSMTAEQKDAVVQRSREYKKTRKHGTPLFCENEETCTPGEMTPTSGRDSFRESNIITPVIQHWSNQIPGSSTGETTQNITSTINSHGHSFQVHGSMREGEAYTHRHNIVDNDQPEDTYGIFEPDERTTNIDTQFEECMDAIHNGESEDDELDEEARIFTEQHVQYESYTVEQHLGNVTSVQGTVDTIYHGLPKKHHVLRKVRDCGYCGAMRIQYEGPAFCCRKGKVGVFIPEVPAELKRLFTNQKDKYAIYFRKHIRYFNSHFSFTSLGVTLDLRVSTAKGTGIYTFRAHGQLYHRLDDLVPGDNGPRQVGVDQVHLNLTDSLNSEQLAGFNEIMDHVTNKRSQVFFVDGPGGTGKTYLYKAL